MIIASSINSIQLKARSRTRRGRSEACSYIKNDVAVQAHILTSLLLPDGYFLFNKCKPHIDFFHLLYNLIQELYSVAVYGCLFDILCTETMIHALDKETCDKTTHGTCWGNLTCLKSRSASAW